MSVTIETVGRERERALLRATVEAARGGRGGSCLVVGEPGIGKSHLVSRLAADAEALGVETVFGRCWEAGGAPAYWPWTEALRGLLRGRTREATDRALGPRAAVLSELLPSVAALDGLAPPPPLEAREARFRLFDVVSTVLRRLADERPILIVLEDLHAADAASVSLLELVARSLDTSAIAVVGTFRPADARVSGVLDGLSRSARLGETIHLAPLDEGAVARLVELVTGRAPSAVERAEIVAASEGNPLFAAELARLVHARANDPRSVDRAALPSKVAAVIGERVERLPAPTVEVLRAASVLGREVPLMDAAALAAMSAVELEAALDPAVRAGLVERVAPAAYRFTHGLVAEVIQRALSAPERTSLHLRIAQILEERHRADPAAPLSRIAHHYFEAGAEAGDRPVELGTRAAERALAVMAYGEAAQLYELALHSLEAVAPDASVRRCALLLSIGHARLQAGDLEAGKAACRAAAQLARTLGSAELLARAALEHGSVFSFGRTDQELVALLEEALAALSTDRPQLRARLLARLAAALQPAPDPEVPIAMAREAIALADEHGDDRVVLSVTRAAVSAMMDYTDPRERLPLNRAYVALATRLGEPAEVLRGRARSIFDHLELGEVDEADRQIDAYEGAARALAHPAFEWLALAFRAMRAIMGGRFAEAEVLREEAAGQAARSGDPNAERALVFQSLGLSRARWDDDALERLLAHPSIAAVPAKHRDVLMKVIHTQRGDRAALAASGPALDGTAIATAGDPHFLTLVAEMAALLEDRSLARALYDALAPHAERYVSWGMVCIYDEGPIEHWLALLAWTLGDLDGASGRFDRALERAHRAGLRPMAARTAFEHGRRLVERPRAEDRARGEALLDEARRLAVEIEAPGLVGRIDAVVRAPSARPDAVVRAPSARPATSATPAPRFSREGDVWALEFAGSTVRMKNTKGLEILARLLDEPGRELHVLELGAPAGTLRREGDAGEAIDARAKEAYRRRVAALREELEEASEWNDLGRADRARGELEQLEAELRRALGLGGRARMAGGSTERARTNVQKRIKSVQRRIAAHHPLLAEHLARTIKTGVYCSYQALPRPVIDAAHRPVEQEGDRNP